MRRLAGLVVTTPTVVGTLSPIAAAVRLKMQGSPDGLASQKDGPAALQRSLEDRVAWPRQAMIHPLRHEP